MSNVSLVHLLFELCPLNIENSHLSHIFMSTLFRERLMHLPFDFIFSQIWHFLDVSAVARHGAVRAALLFSVYIYIESFESFLVRTTVPISL